MALTLPLAGGGSPIASPLQSPLAYQLQVSICTEAEIRVSLANRDLTTATAKLREAEQSISSLESQVWSINMGTSHGEAVAKAWEQRALAAEARAVEADIQLGHWEGRTALAESNLFTTARAATDRERETDNASAILTREVERRLAAQRRATVAEGSLDCLQARVLALSREVAVAEVRAQERIASAEQLAAQRVRDAGRRADQAEAREQSCDRASGQAIAEFRRQTSPARKLASPIVVRRFSLGGATSPAEERICRLRDGSSAAKTPPPMEVVCGKALSTATPAAPNRELHRSGSEATTGLPSTIGTEVGSASCSEAQSSSPVVSQSASQ